MENHQEARKTILIELTSDDAEVRDSFLKHFTNDVEMFADIMAVAFLNWRSLDSEVRGKEKVAYVSSLTLTALTLHILSMKIFLSGQAIAAGNLFRQVVEAIALALLCSGKDLGILERFMNQKYSTNDAPRDVIRKASRLGLDKGAVKTLREVQDFYHEFSHPSFVTMASGVSFSGKGAYVGAAFDEGKIESYKKEIEVRVSLAEVFSNFVDGVKANLAKW